MKPPRTPAISEAKGEVVPSTPFPWTQEYQAMLLKLLLIDRGFAKAVGSHILPSFFQNQVHQWAWATARQYEAAYWALPTLNYLIACAETSPQMRDIYTPVMQAVQRIGILDEQALRAGVMEFVRQNIFRQAHLDSAALFNAGKHIASYDLMRERMMAMENLVMAEDRTSWLAEGFIDRHIERQDNKTAAVATGIVGLDKLLEGGLRPGELGAFIAHSKAGKSILLCNLGINAVRLQFKRVVHYVLEGNRTYIENRYDTLLMDEFYINVKRGDVDSQKYANAVQELQYLKGLCAIVDLTFESSAEGGRVNIRTIHNDLTAKKRMGFVPDLIVTDYVDLMGAAVGDPSNETYQQKTAAKDLQRYMGRGYAGWTVCQVQRPKDDEENQIPRILYASKIADAYQKVRELNFIGSMNQTEQERAQNVMRLHYEHYRDGPAHIIDTIHTEFAKMKFGGSMPAGMTPQLNVPGPAPRTVPMELGYGAMRQLKMGGSGS